MEDSARGDLGATRVATDDSERAFVRDKIQDLRRRLLDLTSRNPLLNYRHPVSSSVRIVDELPNQVVSVLDEQGSFTLEPVPLPSEAELREAGYVKVDPDTDEEISRTEPTSDAWAKQLGIQTEYELPSGETDDRHQDSKLQTLLFPDGLEARLRSIRTRADSAEAEMGCHILFLSVGFLEWFESEDSDRRRLAPLYTVPVDLTRDGLDATEGAFRYRITPRDEDVIDNITLREKLASDFGLALPAIADAEDPEAFFDLVRNSVLKRQPRWKLHRYITLATLNFQKQAMYADLDPARWNDDASILDHHLIRMFFTSVDADAGEEVEARGEYPIDDIPNVVDNYPLVFDADSSQHSAIIDALNGKNLVIEGPPGTGKSQTITNLISASIAAGKSVLFVAEKMAALDVVHSRLEKAGLGAFCLELHGHRAQKTAVIESLAERLGGRFSAPHGIDTEKQLLRSHRDRLNAHAVRVNERWRNTDKTPHQIFAGAARYRSLFDFGSDWPRIEGLSGQSLTPLREQELLDSLQRVAKLHGRVAEQTPEATLDSHYWCGVRQLDLLHSGHAELMAGLRQWTRDLESLVRVVDDAASVSGVETAGAWSTEALEELRAASAALPSLAGRERLESVVAIARDSDACREALDVDSEIHERWRYLAATLSDAALASEESPDLIQANVSALRPLGIAADQSVENLSVLSQKLGKLEHTCEKIERAFAGMRERVPVTLHEVLSATPHGLGEFLVFAGLLQQMPRELWRHRDGRFDDVDMDALLEQLAPQLEKLRRLRGELEATFDLTDLPFVEHIERDVRCMRSGGVLRWLSGSWRAARRSILSLAHADKPSRRRALDEVDRLIEYARGLATIDGLHEANPVLGELYQGVDTPIERIRTVRTWYAAVRAEYGSEFSSRASLADALLQLDAKLAVAIADRADGGLAQAVQSVFKRTAQLGSILPEHLLARDPRAALVGDGGSLRTARSAIDVFLAATTPLLRSSDLALADAVKAAQALGEHRESVAAWPDLACSVAARDAGFELSPEYGEQRESELATLRASLRVAECLTGHSALVSAFTARPDANRYEALQALADQVAKPLAEAIGSRDEFASAGDIDLDVWSRFSGDSLPALIERNQQALQREAWLADWLGYQRVKASLLPQGLGRLIRHIEEAGLDEQQVTETAIAVLYRQLADEILESDAELRDFYGPDQESVRERFQECDRHVLQLKRQEIANEVARRDVPAGRSGGRVREYTDRVLVEHEVQKKKRHIPLRDLLDRAGDAVTALKPCFMMSPMSVATHLQPGRHRFDLLIMDEASQIKPEDALGAIARADSLVVVGDPKQLPPTSFFDRAIDGDEDSEDQVTLDDSESILEAVSGIFPTRRLRWHYRSRHESLIEFSAKSFYHNDLVLFPSPYETDPEYGVKVHPVEDGFFQKVNAPESRAVVDFLVEHLESSPDESIGIVAMSAAQCTLICEQVEARMKSDPRARALIEQQLQGDEPLFFKNLESVQGDERDVIVISMTYGPQTPGGTVPQRFGPINRSDGWRRLNVLFTRAKKRMHVFTSMSAADVVCDPRASGGKKALREFLAYCEKTPESHADQTGRATDSDFEVSVMQALEAEGYSCTAQLGVAGYFLDLAVRDPEDPNRYLLGVECDGATYHSAKSARDRDRLREEVLRDLGWRIERIWSTDWFRNPEPQVQRIVNAIREAQRERA